jgi:hypothetical protein
MKKLMIAAAVAAMGAGAFADCDIVEPPAGNCAEVYDVVFNLKTTECKCKVLTTKTSGSECGITTHGKIEECVAWRQVVTKKVQGVIFSCFCDCTDDVAGSVLDGNVFAPAIWNGLTTDAMEGNQYFWIDKDKIVLPADDLLTIKWIARIGKTLNQVEAAGTFGEGIYVAGYGAYDTKNGRVKNITGNAAGVWGADIDCSDEEGQELCPAYDLCDPTTAVADFTKTFAAGTWTVKYNDSKSKALAKNRNSLWGKVVPAKVARYDLATWYQSIAL